LFSQQHYNAVAKLFRENFPMTDQLLRREDNDERKKLLLQRGTVVDLAIDFAKYFKKDNPSFDPIKFLDHCSPDVDFYPLSELWENEDG
jgi:hypothetical protein